MAKMTIEQAPLWIRRMWGKRREAAVRGIRAAAHRMVGHITNELIPREPRIPVDRGTYRAGWRVREIEGGAIVSNDVPHATFIEDGVRGDNVKIGRAMIDALQKWIVRKGLTGTAKGQERALEAKRIAWAIAQSMRKKGIFGQSGLKILERANKRAKEWIDEEVRRELEREG